MEKPLAQIARQGGTVRLVLPAAIANDLGQLKVGIANFLERLGCRECFSGADCLFQLERNFVLNEKMAATTALPQDPDPIIPFVGHLSLQPAVPVMVSISKEVTFDLRRVETAIGRVLDKLGCRACCSGFDIFFRRELNMLNVDGDLNVTGTAQFR